MGPRLSGKEIRDISFCRRHIFCLVVLVVRLAKHKEISLAGDDGQDETGT